jgi:hypothetical protein
VSLAVSGPDASNTATKDGYSTVSATSTGLVQLVRIKRPNYHAARAGAAAITLAANFVDQLNGCAC